MVGVIDYLYSLPASIGPVAGQQWPGGMDQAAAVSDSDHSPRSLSQNPQASLPPPSQDLGADPPPPSPQAAYSPVHQADSAVDPPPAYESPPQVPGPQPSPFTFPFLLVD